MNEWKPRVFRIPVCPDDMERGVDVEGIVWTRRKSPRGRTLWDSVDEYGNKQTHRWRELMAGMGGLTEVPDDGRA